MDVEVQADLHGGLERFGVVQWTKDLAWRKNFVVEVKI